MSAYIVLWFFLSRTPARIVTTSADYSQLNAVLWGELRRFIQTCRVPLSSTQGGPLVITHMHLRKLIRPEDNVPVTYKDLSKYDKPLRNHERPARDMWKDKVKLSPTQHVCGVSYCIGRVAAKGEGMLGHHIAETGDGIPRTLWVGDEASGLEDESYERATTWAKRMLIIGNAYNSNNNFFYRAVKDGDIVAR